MVCVISLISLQITCITLYQIQISVLHQLSFGKPLVLWRPVSILQLHRLPPPVIGLGLQGLWDMTVTLSQSEVTKLSETEFAFSKKSLDVYHCRRDISVPIKENPSVN